MSGLNIAFFGSSLVSAYWNGAATYYRGIVRALADRGHEITFYEPDVCDRQQHRDIPDPPWAKVVVYPARTPEDVYAALDETHDVDLVIKASGVGVFDEVLEEAVAHMRGLGKLLVYWDVDAPATLDRIQQHPQDRLRPLIPMFDMIFTYGGGDPVVRGYRALGARQCVPIYNALDPSTHYPVPPDPQFQADLAFLGNRRPDRESRVDEFFLKAAQQHAGSFLLGGCGWEDKPMPHNVRYLGHVYTRDHNAFNSTPRTVLNISRDSMANYGYSPATRIFEAAGACACLITDYWEGIEMFLDPGREVLVARDGDEVVEHLRSLKPARARSIGRAAFRRILDEHTYAHRAALVEQLLDARHPVL